MRILAIDPGIAGAVAVLTESGAFIEAVDMPTVLANKSSSKQMVDAYGLASFVRKHVLEANGDIVALIENVQPMPSIGRGKDADSDERRSMGAASAFAFGKSCGIPLGMIAYAGLSVEFVAPARWKKAFGLGREKDQSRELALRLWPTATDVLKRKKDHNRADALLIARWYADVQRRGETFHTERLIAPLAQDTVRVVPMRADGKPF